MDLKKLVGALALLMFVFGGIACSSNDEVDEEIVAEGIEDGAEELGDDESFSEDESFEEAEYEDSGETIDDDSIGIDDGSTEVASDYVEDSYTETIEEPVQEIAQDNSFQDQSYSEPQEAVSLGSSSSGLGK